MKSRQRRLKEIELNLTPQQVVMLWLKNALQWGTLEKAVRCTPLPRAAVANAVRNTVLCSMKGQPDLMVEQAVLQARREADLLYNLVGKANAEVGASREQREREYVLLLGYLGSQWSGKITKDGISILRAAVLMFLESVIVLDASIAQVAAERLNSQPVLFDDCRENLKEQLQMAEQLAENFNELAREADLPEIHTEELRHNLRSETDRRVSVWVSHAQMEMLSLFGNRGEIHAAMDQFFLLFEARSGEVNTDLANA